MTQPPGPTVAIVAKPRREAVDLAATVRRWLLDRGARVLLDGTTAEWLGETSGSGPASLRKADLLVVLGGDGTLLHAAGMLAGARVPIFGVNLGFLGFLTEIARERLFEMLEPALRGEMEIAERMLLRVSLERGGRRLLRRLVLNDAVAAKGALARIAELECRIDGRPVARYRADGLIVATPTGSTAYNLSAGGPILHPSIDAMVVTPICPHTLSQRPLVVPQDSVLELVVAGDDGAPRPMYLTVDGERGRALRAGDRVVVERADSRVYLVRDAGLDYYRILRERLGWGG